MSDKSATYSTSLIIFLGLLTAITPMSTDMYLPALPIMPQEFNTTGSIIQLTLTTMMVGMAIGQVVAGPITDSFGRKWPLVLGNLLCGISSFMCAFAPSIEILLIGRFLQGLTGALSVVVAKAVARDKATGQALTKLFALLMMVNGLAPVVAPLIGGLVLAYATWRTVFVLIALFCLILFGWSLTFTETLPKERRIPFGLQETLSNFRMLLTDKSFLGQCLIQWFAFGAFFAYISGSAFVYQNVYHLSAQTFSYVFGINSITLILSGWISGKLSATVANTTQLKVSLWQLTIGGLLTLLCLLWEAPFLLTAVVILLTVCTVSVYGAASFAMALSSHGKIAGSATALIGFFSMASAGFMAPLVGIMGENTGVPMGIIITVGGAIALILYYKLVKPYDE